MTAAHSSSIKAFLLATMHVALASCQRRRLGLTLPTVLAVALLLQMQAAFAFNAAGHKIIAEIAWRKLDPAERSAIAQVLKSHPRFAEDFEQAMEDEVGDESTDVQNHWVFCHAATWPDIARGIPSPDRAEYHRPRWHYINLPVFLNEEQATVFAGNLPANVDFELSSGMDETMLNGVQAVKRSLGIVMNPRANAAERAVHYCWLLHLIADLHQPLHTSALFSVPTFPQGDQGGNRILIRREGTSANGKKLHAVFDGFLGSSPSFTNIRTRAGQLIDDYPGEYDVPFTAIPFDVWTTEVQQVALEVAYGPLLDSVFEADQAGKDLDVLEVPESYYAASGAETKRQAVLAGARLAAILSKSLTSSSPRPASPRRALGFAAVIAAPQSSTAATQLKQASLTGDRQLMAISARLERLEMYVRSLHSTQPFDAGMFQHNPNAARAWQSGDGEQCTCGADE